MTDQVVTGPEYRSTLGFEFSRETIPPVSSEELPALIEALLLVAPDPVTVAELVAVASASREDIIAALSNLRHEIDRGWVVVEHQDAVHLASAPRFAAHVRRFLRLERESRLSGAALETLALVAYRQPVTRAEIDSLRGVDSSGVLSTLLARGLIEVSGRLPTVGNPNQYITSIEFLRQFGLTSLADLPPLEDASRRNSDSQPPFGLESLDTVSMTGVASESD